MKNLVKSFILVASFAVVNSCSNDTISESPVLDKTNSVEFNDNNYFYNNDGSVAKFSKNVKQYDIVLNMKYEFEIDQNSNYRSNEEGNIHSYLRIGNTETNEFFDIINLEGFEDYYRFDISTSNNDLLEGFKIYDKDFISYLSTDSLSRNDQQRACPICPFIPVIIDAVIELFSDSALEQCAASMPETCSEGKDPYMKFSEGFFSTSCEVGCK